MDSSGAYPDLLGDALSHSSQRVAQLGSLLASWTMVQARRKQQRTAAEAARSQQALEALREQERAARQLAQAGWAPADDRQWLTQADLLQTARVWSAATAYADSDTHAASAARRCEERLRTLHPYAMAWYDRLRAEGAAPFDAMREAVPLFARASHARPGGPAPERRSLTASASPQAAAPASQAPESVRQPGPDHQPAASAEHRGRQIVSAMQARAFYERGSELSPDELATVLSAKTSLSPEVIARLARGDSQEQAAAAAERDRAFDLDRATAATHGGERTGFPGEASQEKLAADTASAHASTNKNAARLAAESFPCTAADAIRAAATASPREGQVRARMLAVQNIRRPGRSV